MLKKRIGWGIWIFFAALLYFFENNTGTRILLVATLVLPLLSVLCAAENVSPKIIETVDAAALKQAALGGEFGRCYLEGPISLDLALDAESAKIKGYESPVTGKTDILVVPSMSAGNIMVKALIEFAGAKMAGVVIGAKCPIALNSRSASFEEKYNSLLVCALMSGGKGAKA